MALSYFVIPDTSTIVYEGDIVVLSEYPEKFAIASHGWYEYQETRANGWYFILLPSREIIPAANTNVSLITVVTSTICPSPSPTPIPDPDEHNAHRTFITVNTITDRDALVPEFIPNGRIVRVNDTVEGQPEYYQWNAESKEWETWDIQESISNVSIELATAVESLEEEIDEVSTSLSAEIEQSTANLHNEIEESAASLAAEINTKLDNVDGIITTSKLADESISYEKLDSELQSKIDEISELQDTVGTLNDQLENALNGVSS